MGSTVQLSRRYSRVVQLELNEISSDVISKLVAEGELPNFRRLGQQCRFLRTDSESRYELLEPWIQWITAHTGKTYEEHRVFRLSDVAALNHPQIWESLSEHEVSSLVIGSMNATQGKALGGVFFPDPWSKEGRVTPATWQPLWDLISRRVQGHATQAIPLGDMVRGALIASRMGVRPSLFLQIFMQLIRQRLRPSSRWRLAALFDEFLADIFLHLLRKGEAGFNTLFLNAIAHYQHHHWRRFDPAKFPSDLATPDCGNTDDPMRHGYLTYDRILGRVLDELAGTDTLLLVVSGLSQVPFTAKDSEGGMNYYRLRNHSDFTQQLGLPALGVFPLMSRDWQLRGSDSELDLATERLKSLSVNGEPLFRVMRNQPGFLFVETALTQAVPTDACIRSVDGKYSKPFWDTFTHIAIKSGHHIGTGSVWISDPLPLLQADSIPLTQVHDLTLAAHGVL